MKSLVLRHGWTFVVLSATLTYFLALRSFGFQLEDEGTLLFQLGRAANGGLPYVDFHTGYTPGFFALGSWLIRSVGYSVEGIRTALALVNAASVVLLYLLARRAVGARLALVPAIAWLAAIPVDVGAFASFNVPYPAWPVALAWLVLALSLLVWAESGKTGALVVAGLAAAAAFSLKPNAGAYAVAACVWTVSSLGRRHSRLDVVVARVASAAMALGVFSVFSQTLGLPRWGVDVVVHLGPVAAVAALWSARAAVRAGPGPGHGVFAALAVVGVAFTLPTLAWVVPVVMELGLNTFGSEVLLLGSRAAEIYYSSHPIAQRWAVAVVLGVLAVAVCGHFVRRGLLHPGRLAIAAGVIGSGGLLVLQATALAPQSLPASVSMQLENASFWLAPLSNWAGIAYLYFFGTRRGSQRTRRWLYVIVPVATAMYLQLYPRTDFMHLVFSVPLTAVLATVLLRRVAAWWTEGMGSHGRTIVGTAIAVAVVLAVALRLGPVLALAYAPVGGGATEIEAGRLEVWAGSGTSDDLQALAMVVDFLRGQAEEGSDVLHFPALGGVLFAAGLSTPLAHDY
ncbi:MAG: glycosyltransferase family 39 protein, partial [Deltaproteobacteria bacterium]